MNLRLVSLCLIMAAFPFIGSLAQCVPNTSITTPGIYPDSATGLPGGTVGMNYNEVIQVKVLTDTTYNGLPVIITNITVTSVSGLPPGINYQCNPSNCVFPGGSNGCVLLSGIPSTAGTYPLVVNLLVNGTSFGVPVPPQPMVIDWYSITINQPTGIADAASVKFKLDPNVPNPASEYTEIRFTTPVSGDFSLKIYDILGKEVHGSMIRGKRGSNTYRINTDRFNGGVYLISLNNGKDIISRKMTVMSR